MIRSLDTLLVQHPEIPRNDGAQKKHKYDFDIRDYAIKIIFPDNYQLSINVKDQEPITKHSFYELMNTQKENNLPYVLGVVEDKASHFHFVDASNLIENQKENVAILLTKIFYFTFEFQGTENECFHYLGNLHESPEKIMFIKNYIKATKNDPIAQFNLAQRFGVGDGVDQNPIQAARWFKHSADLGFTEAEISLGLCYSQGIGTENNPQEAARLFKRASLKGNVDAQCNLGICYYRGYGVNQNYDKALRWFTLAADEGHAEAQCNLGICYFLGHGVDPNFDIAMSLFADSANQGNTIALAHLEFYNNPIANLDGNPGSTPKKTKYFDF